MRKRHLEILGYHVLQVSKERIVPFTTTQLQKKKICRLINCCPTQIPHFEWNSMELSTPDAWKEYLRKKLFTEVT